MNQVKHVVQGKGIVGFLLALICFPNLVSGGCVFGSRNLADLTSRNNTILGTMNATLVHYTEMAQTDLSKVSNFNIRDFLAKNPYSVNASNYLDFTSKGKMLSINWTTVTQMAKQNGTIGEYATLDLYISRQFADSVHAALQELATNYSFSMGIFRPNQTRFNFPGLTTNLSGTSSLDMSCSAGSAFLWRISTTLNNTVSLTNPLSTEFATFATALESRFDSYYRGHVTLGINFVRVNVLRTSPAVQLNNTVGFMEVYFLNGSYQQANIQSETNISQFTKIVYNDGISIQSEFQVKNMEMYTYIINASYAPNTIPFNETPSTLYNTSSSTYDFIQTFAVNSSSPVTMNLETVTPTAKTAIKTTTKATTQSSQHITTGTSSVQANISLLASPTPTEIIALSSSLTATPSSDALIANQSVVLSDTLPIQTQSSSEILNATVVNGTAANTSFQASQTSSILAANTNSFLNNQTTIAGNSVTVGSATYFYNNTKNGGTTNTPSNGTNITSGTTTNGVVNKQRTTYDVDPFFKANVPVITKVYNDEYLLRLKLGTTAPITQRKAFFSITIPAIIGMLIAVTACMFCWQIDCSRRNEKLLIS